jgi:hypothetical protein
MTTLGIAVAAVVAFLTGVMTGVVVATALAIRSRGRRHSRVGLSLDLLELKVRRLMGPAVHGSSAHSDG